MYRRGRKSGADFYQRVDRGRASEGLCVLHKHYNKNKK
jgi:hypothetical protein